MNQFEKAVQALDKAAEEYEKLPERYRNRFVLEDVRKEANNLREISQALKDVN